ncbi:Ca2+:H+ antiporter [Scopulibacillus darangshiensis]|uniref:Ca(2+)/H(+) antiporter n=1 Tax=Scopulibacillus darangshiensis TaxID=442528 RepID=A0A4V2SNJ6_9BACL|nr:calcium/proton exchanger [Scopulibacillus darangshiensis]TCP31336.1 Ca2+:H+ antiporter [Scopulibacillus darangshiensis]
MNKVFFILMVIGVPLSVIGGFFDWNFILMFFIYCMTIISLANYIRRSTECLAVVVGETAGGLLNATFGNAAEIIIAFFALREGLNTVVISSITGMVLVNLLFAGGLSMLIGGLRFKKQEFDVFKARHNTGLLMFGIVVTFVLPFIFVSRIDKTDIKILSTAFAIVMLIIYLLALFFKLVTHKSVFTGKKGEDGEEEEPEWGKWKAMIILGLATVVLAYVSEKLVGTIEPVGNTLGWSDVFIGIIVVAVVGSAAEYVSSISMAYKNRMDVMLEISIGSTVQTAMFVAPILVLVSWFFNFLPLVFNTSELVAMILAAFMTVTIVNDGDSNWFEGALLVGTYIAMGFGFYLL